MQLFSDVALVVCRESSGLVRRNGLLPHAESREDMRGHMQRMGSGRRDFRVRARRTETLRGHFLVVARMDQIMGDSGVVGVCAEERVENLGGAFLLHVGFVERRRAREK